MPNNGDSVVAAPSSYLFGAVAACVISLLLLIPRTMPTSMLGYVLTPIAVTVLVAVFRMGDIRASRSLYYSPNPGQRRLALGAMAAAFLLAVPHSWIIATEIAKAVS